MYDLKPFPVSNFSLINEYTGFDRRYENRDFSNMSKEELKEILNSTEKEIEKLKDEYEDMKYAGRSAGLAFPLKERIKREQDFLERIQKALDNLN